MATNKRAIVERMEAQSAHAAAQGMTLGECLVVCVRALVIGAALLAVCGALVWVMTLD